MTVGATLSPHRGVLPAAPPPAASAAALEARLDRQGPGSDTPVRLIFLVVALALIAVGVGA